MRCYVLPGARSFASHIAPEAVAEVVPKRIAAMGGCCSRTRSQLRSRLSRDQSNWLRSRTGHDGRTIDRGEPDGPPAHSRGLHSGTNCTSER